MLWIVVIGLAALGIWKIARGILAVAPEQKRKWLKRIEEFAKAVIYLAIAATALTFANGGSTSTAQSTGGFADALVRTPWGHRARDHRTRRDRHRRVLRLSGCRPKVHREHHRAADLRARGGCARGCRLRRQGGCARCDRDRVRRCRL